MKTSHSLSKTRRKAYRFPCNNHKVAYKTEYEDGTALLSDISTQGCAIKQTSIPLMPKQKVLLIIEAEDIEGSLEATGVVVRADDGITAIQFTIIEKETAKNIQIFFSKKNREMKRSIIETDEQN